jgi:3-oxoacyl-[acyl-carrier protein] reductase
MILFNSWLILVMELGLTNKVALVTASSKGIGHGIAKALLAEGAKVVISSRSVENLKLAESSLRTKSEYHVDSFQADLTVEEDLKRLAEFLMEKYDGADILVYNSGPPKVGRFQDLDLADWEYASRLLLLSAVSLCQKLVPGMITRRWGRLIFVTSLTLREPKPNLVLSNTVRLGLAGLMKSLSVELGQFGITSNAIAQGHILTDRVKQTTEFDAKQQGRSPEEVLGDIIKQIPTGRLGSAEEIGDLVAFLASEKASYINGSFISIDGGLVRSLL